MPTTVRISRADAHELLVVLALALAAALNLIDTDVQSPTLVRALGDGPALIAYGIGVLIGAKLVVIGAVLVEYALRAQGSTLATGLGVERAGLYILAPLVAVYGLAILVLVGWTGFFAAALALSVALAHVVRVRRIGLDLAALATLTAPDQSGEPTDPPEASQ